MTTTAKPIENCWKITGVWGQEARLSCQKLHRVIHCRNCEVFTQAGRALLERDLSSEYKVEWTEVLALEKEEELIGTISVAIFRLEGEWFALSTQLFEEVINVEHVRNLLHRIPHRKNPVLMGLINIHGEIGLCVSLKELLGLEANDPIGEKKDERSAYKRMMVIQGEREGEHWVFPADEIHGIYRVHPNAFQNVPVTVAKAKTTFTKGIWLWDNRQVAFLDDELLLYSLTRSVK